jgi:hypothetical protein
MRTPHRAEALVWEESQVLTGMTALARSRNHRRLCDYYSPTLVASEIPIPKKLVSYVGLASGTRESVEKTIHG